MHNTLLFENMSVLFWTIALLITFVFALPSVIAFTRRHKYRWIILAINIIFGATGVGWLLAFIWAVWPQKTSLVDPIGDPSGKGEMAKEFGERTATYNHYAQNRAKANFCGNCGEKISETANFCSSCGNEVNSSGIQNHNADYEEDYGETTDVADRPKPLDYIRNGFGLLLFTLFVVVGIFGLFVHIPTLEIEAITRYEAMEKTFWESVFWDSITDIPLWADIIIIPFGIFCIWLFIRVLKMM